MEARQRGDLSNDPRAYPGPIDAVRLLEEAFRSSLWNKCRPSSFVQIFGVQALSSKGQYMMRVGQDKERQAAYCFGCCHPKFTSIRISSIEFSDNLSSNICRRDARSGDLAS